MIYYHIGVTVSFNHSEYSIVENDGILQPVLVLSDPLSFDAEVNVKDKPKTTTRK